MSPVSERAAADSDKEFNLPGNAALRRCDGAIISGSRRRRHRHRRRRCARPDLFLLSGIGRGRSRVEAQLLYSGRLQTSLLLTRCCYRCKSSTFEGGGA